VCFFVCSCMLSWIACHKHNMDSQSLDIRNPLTLMLTLTLAFLQDYPVHLSTSHYNCSGFDCPDFIQTPFSYMSFLVFLSSCGFCLYCSMGYCLNIYYYCCYYYYYYHFTALWILSGTTRVSRHQKDKTGKVNVPIWIYWSKR